MSKISMNCFTISRKKTTKVKTNNFPLKNQELGCEPDAKALQSQQTFSYEALDQNEFELYERSNFIGTRDYRNPIPTRFEKHRLRFFLGQDVQRIRERTSNSFDDPYFLKYVSSIVENTDSLLFVSLKTRLGSSSDDLEELNQLVKWLRLEQIVNFRGKKLEPEFVLDENGHSPKDANLSLSDYSQFFSIDDIFQGWLGNCFHVGAMMALTRNPKLLELVIPPDNLSNIRSGVYHFRFWRLGFWYDVCVDDFLPTSSTTGELIFSHNDVYPNEFWVPLFEKAFAKFIGSYDELEGGLFENSALYLSGGLHQEYRTTLAIKMSSQASETDPESKEHPNCHELFEIIRLALKKADMIGCILEDEEMALKYGLYKEHFYLISQVLVLEKTNARFIKIHNPFNTKEKVKNSPRYLQLEAKLRTFGVPATKDGEFWRVKVCNLQPEEALSFSVNPEAQHLKKKTSLLTEWKCIAFRGSLPASVRKLNWTEESYRKFTLEIKGSTAKDIILSFIQDWIRRNSRDMELQLIGLRIFVYSRENKEWNFLKCLWYQESLQWCLRTSLEPGLYLLIYESGYNDLANDLHYCFRVFYDARENPDELQVNIFDQEPPFEPDYLEQ